VKERQFGEKGKRESERNGGWAVKGEK